MNDPDLELVRKRHPDIPQECLSGVEPDHTTDQEHQEKP